MVERFVTQKRDSLRLSLFGIGLLLMAVTAWITHDRIGRQKAEAGEVAHTYQVLREIDALQGALLSASSNRWALSATGDLLFQKLIEEDVLELHRADASLRELTADNPEQGAESAPLRSLLDKRITQVGRPAVEESRSVLLQWFTQGRVTTQDILAILHRMEGRERRLLAEREDRARRGSSATVRASLLSGGAGLGVLTLCFLLLLREVRERRHVELELQDLNRRLDEAGAETRAFFEGSMDLTGVANLDGYFKRVNASWTRILGWSPGEVTTKPWMDFVHPDDRDATLQAGAGLSQGQAAVQFENRYRTKAGGWRWISWNVPAPLPGSQLLHAIGRDVTERKAGEEQLRSLNSRLEEVNRELEAFSYSVSHDLRAPLRHTNGFVELLEKHAGAALDDTSRRYLRTIADSSKKMGRLIDDLLGFSRAGRVELRPSRVSMERAADEVWRSFEPDIEGRKVSFERGPLPEVMGDPALLRQVWANILSNAVKYTKNVPEARIEVGTTEMPGRGTVFCVRDNGAGFDMRFAGKLFGVFQRLHSNHEFEGTGIGLANVKRIILRHGGALWAEGKVGEGAVFYFTLPLAGEPGR